MLRLLIATTNSGKLREIQRLLLDTGADVLGLADAPPVPEPEETGVTFRDNARLKAFYYDAQAAAALDPRPWTVAEDSGLAVDALGGEPGVHSARYLRPLASYPERFAEIQRRLTTGTPRTARFICAVAVVRRGELIFETTGTVEGEIADAARGDEGFGYDPIFYYPPYRRTFGQIAEEEKLRVAHRGLAFRQLSQWLRSGGGEGGGI